MDLRDIIANLIRKILPLIVAAFVGGAAARYLPGPVGAAVNTGANLVAPSVANAAACAVNPADPACAKK